MDNFSASASLPLFSKPSFLIETLPWLPSFPAQTSEHNLPACCLLSQPQNIITTIPWDVSACLFHQVLLLLPGTRFSKISPSANSCLCTKIKLIRNRMWWYMLIVAACWSLR